MNNNHNQWIIPIGGSLHTFKSKQAACRIYGITPQCLNQRLHQYGWDPERALLTPVKMSRLETATREELDYRGFYYIQNRAIRNLIATHTDYDMREMMLAGDDYSQLAMVHFNELSRYDFLIISGRMIIAAIECDGTPHFRPSMRRWDMQQIRDIDRAKDAFMEANGIPLLRIRYDQEDQIPELIDDLLLYPDYYITHHSRLQNYYGKEG